MVYRSGLRGNLNVILNRMVQEDVIAGFRTNLSDLPEPLNDGMGFFRTAIEERVVCVPGEFFDINPGKRRSGRPSRFRSYARFSFGPEEKFVTEGVRRIAALVERARRGEIEASED